MNPAEQADFIEKQRRGWHSADVAAARERDRRNAPARARRRKWRAKFFDQIAEG